MKLSKAFERKLKKDGVKEWKKWYKIFVWQYNFPDPITKQQREVIAHNLALQVVWEKQDIKQLK